MPKKNALNPIISTLVEVEEENVVLEETYVPKDPYTQRLISCKKNRP